MTSIRALGQQLRSGATTCAHLAAEALAAGESDGKRLNAFITLTPGDALSRADALDDELRLGKDRGPLHGIPVAVKDTFYTRGVLTTDGSKIFADFVPEYDAAVVESLEAAGGVIIGKTNQHELAYGITSENPHYGPVHNPRGFDCIPGGSSGGSGAAVAAGIVPMAMGTDTGGSIRNPASFCGIAGLKPTYGRVSRYGCHALGLSLDTMGPLATNVEDCAITLNVLAGHDMRDPSSSRRPVDDYTAKLASSLKGVKIGWPGNFFFDSLDADVARAVERARDLARDAGAVIVPVRVPDIAALNAMVRVILLCEAAALMAKYTHRRQDFGADVIALLDQGRFIAAMDYVNAQRKRSDFQRQFRELFRGIDCLFTPVTPTTAPGIGQKTVMINGAEEDTRLASTRLIRGINAMGYPAMSIPCGTSGGMPIGLQIVGKPFEEAALLGIAAQMEKLVTGGD